ncbi:asparagine synthase (glutamine-hydrolyzing) [Kordiimonas pumila]|uniref:asparagine synthase (glutamine-hydrolyzing) n=1 Tax=Kordiimonas pumila TaxID=2161677 RepID=A0ABV7D3T8_9PROT|nr:asparagine synthase (glutamine-hydrolyzing) [Kordiimonas pumila]
MCGIVGLVSADFPAGELPQIISNALSAIGHRGPDGSGYVVADDFVMGTVRLAILDQKAGIQPISDEEGRYWLCYNGEVYNYRELKAELEEKGHIFKTQCDTEVVLRAWIEWGEGCLSRFNGGYAFALYDRRTKRMVLARDRFGKRPLFYHVRGNALYFASEMKAFLAIPGFAFEQDPAQLGSIVAQWTPLPDQTGFKHVHSLPMGQFLSFLNGEIACHTYYQLTFDSSRQVTNEKDAVEQIRAELDKSVSLRLRSDVEVGVYLSGGIDSAIVAHLARQYNNHDLYTFSVTFEDSQFDESLEQNLVSQHIGTKHLAKHITYKDIVDAFPDAVYHAEIPAFRSAFVPMYLLSELTAENNIKVILSGEGADEAFLGYDLFKETILRSEWDDLSEDLRSERLSSFYPHLAHYAGGSNAAVAGLYQQFSKENMPGLFSHEIRFQNGRFSARLMMPDGAQDPFADIMGLTQSSGEFASMSAVQKAQWLEYKTLLSGYLLSTQGERMSLSHGVENRCPFLDLAVIDVAAATNLKFDNGFREKRLLREAFRADLPAEVVDKRKFPYRAPDTEAFIAEKPDYLDLVLSDSELSKLPFINKKFAGLLTKKLINTAPEKISTKEHQTFMFLLGIAMTNHFFVERSGRGASGKLGNLPPLQKVVDLRT